MSILTQAHYLDLVPELRAPVVVHVSQGDSGTTISFDILQQGKAYAFTNESVVVHGTRQDGVHFGPFVCSKSGSTVSFQTDNTMTAIEGSAIAEISIVNGIIEKVGTANFAILVEKASFPNGVTYSNDVSVYENILRYAQIIESDSTTRINNFRTEVDNDIDTLENEISTFESSSTASLNNLRATVENEMSTFETDVNSRVNQIVSQAGTDNTEIVDSRLTFKNVSKTNLKLRLNEFLEFDAVGTTEGIGSIDDLEEEITETVISWLNTHPANLVYASDGTIARYIIRSTSDIDNYN